MPYTTLSYTLVQLPCYQSFIFVSRSIFSMICRSFHKNSWLSFMFRDCQYSVAYFSHVPWLLSLNHVPWFSSFHFIQWLSLCSLVVVFQSCSLIVNFQSHSMIVALFRDCCLWIMLRECRLSISFNDCRSVQVSGFTTSVFNFSLGRAKFTEAIFTPPHPVRKLIWWR